MAMTLHCRHIANQVARFHIERALIKLRVIPTTSLPYINCMLILSSDAWVRSTDVRKLNRVPIWCLWFGRIALETDHRK